MIDVGMMWKDVKGAIKTAKAMEEYGVYWIEEPFSPDDLDAYRRLADSTHIHIAGGEEVGTAYEYQELLDKRCVDILQPDLSRCGGITVARKLTDLCDMRRVQVTPTPSRPTCSWPPPSSTSPPCPTPGTWSSANRTPSSAGS